MHTPPETEFSKAVLRDFGHVTPEPGPSVTHVPEGDCIEFLAEHCDFLGERFDERVTFLYSMDDHEKLVGMVLKNVSKICGYIQSRPSLSAMIHDGCVGVEVLLLAHLQEQEEELRRLQEEVKHTQDEVQEIKKELRIMRKREQAMMHRRPQAALGGLVDDMRSSGLKAACV